MSEPMAQGTTPSTNPDTAVPAPRRQGEITLRLHPPSLPFLAVALGFALVFIGVIIAVSGSGPSATANGAANAIFAGKILSVIGLLAVGGGAGLNLLQSPKLADDGPAGARVRYAVHRVLAVALFLAALYLLVLLL